MLMLLLVPVVLLGMLVTWTANVWKTRSIRSAPSGLTTMLLALCVSYTLALLIVCVNPWFSDNGGPGIHRMAVSVGMGQRSSPADWRYLPSP